MKVTSCAAEHRAPDQILIRENGAVVAGVLVMPCEPESGCVALQDLAAVTAGLTQPWNSGVVEEHVNRVKMLKRQMFGRAGFALLRKRVLLS